MDDVNNILPEYVYIHDMTVVNNTSSNNSLTIISINKLNNSSKKVKLSTIDKKCYINGYGLYDPNKIKKY